MTDRDGEKYKCFLPNHEENKGSKESNQQYSSSVTPVTDKQSKAKTPDELLESLNNDCFLRVRIIQSCWLCYTILICSVFLCQLSITMDFLAINEILKWFAVHFLTSVWMICYLQCHHGKLYLVDSVVMQHEGWWSYEFCYQAKVRQFHQEEKKVAIWHSIQISILSFWWALWGHLCSSYFVNINIFVCDFILLWHSNF